MLFLDDLKLISQIQLVFQGQKENCRLLVCLSLSLSDEDFWLELEIMNELTPVDIAMLIELEFFHILKVTT